MQEYRRERILIADDSARNRRTLRELLEADFDIVTAAGGQQAVELLRLHHEEIDLVLLDIAMAENGGFDVLAEMGRQKWLADTPVIMIVNEPVNAHMEYAFRLGASDYIRRPFMPSILIRRIRNTLALHKRKTHMLEKALDAAFLDQEQRSAARNLIDRIDQNELFSSPEKETIFSQLLASNRQVYIDSVTNVCNRRYYDDRLRDLDGQYAFAMIDMDNFKSVNDCFGHQAGDAALYHAAQTIKAEILPEDELVRYGGDEFFLVFHDLPFDKLEEKLLTIRSKLESIRIPEYPDLRISASIGGACGSGKMSQMLRRADLAMYRAKTRRDCVKIYDPSDEDVPDADIWTENVSLAWSQRTEERDNEVTWLYNRGTFFEAARKMIDAHEAGYYLISSVNIHGFQDICEQYGAESGAEVTQHTGDSLERFCDMVDGLCTCFSQDEFALLLPASCLDSEEIRAAYALATGPKCIPQRIRLRVGRYLVERTEHPVSVMYDRARIAENSIQSGYASPIYSAAARSELMKRQHLLDEILDALHGGEFEPWFQPQYNHATGAVIGAEALARWKRGGEYILPAQFVPVLEQRGLIYQLDQQIWEKVCRQLRRWLDEGRKPLPVSVNISRRDVMHDDFIPVLTGIVEKYRIPQSLFWLEITESALVDSANQLVQKVNELIGMGYVVEIDDFGSGYSTLNSLKDVPAAILKLDMRFFENTGNSDRAGIIVESVVRMAKWLGMNIIAEGVEKREQADFLKSLGCNYIQGYYYAHPMPLSEYEALLDRCDREPELRRLKRVAELENSSFWDPDSMETLIFNSYVGGACIFEYHDGQTELLRINDRYVQVFGRVMEQHGDAKRLHIMQYMDEANQQRLLAAIRAAMDSGEETSCEVRVSRDIYTEYLRISVRIIARTEDRALGYSLVMNVTEQREAERKERNASRQLRSIMNSVRGGVLATVFRSPTDIDVIFTNDGFYKLHGYTRAQYEAEVGFINDLLYAEDRDWVGQAVAEVVRTGKTNTYEYRAYKRDGSVIWIRMTNSVVSLEGVGDKVLLGIETDVTEEHLAQQRQAEANEQLRFLNETAHELLAWPDSEQAIRQTLLRFMAYFRSDRAYVVEIDHDRQVVNNTYEVCAQGVKSEMDMLQNVPVSLSPSWFETLRENEQVVIGSVEALDDGQKELRELLLAQDIHSILITPLLREGRLIGYTGVDNPKQSLDHRRHLSALGDYITVLLVRRNLSTGLASEQRMLCTLMDDIEDGFVRLKVGADGKYVLEFINESMCRFLRSDAETLRALYGEDTLRCIHPDDRQAAIENIHRCIESGGFTGKHVRYRLLRGDGSYVRISLSVCESRDEQGCRCLNLFYYLNTAEEVGQA